MVQYFSLTTNQPTVLSVMAYQPSEQDAEVFKIQQSFLPIMNRLFEFELSLEAKRS
jgi:hypothetical protein